jgi:hypothetical protein
MVRFGRVRLSTIDTDLTKIKRLISIIYGLFGAITQLVECHNGIVKATGSSPVSSIFSKPLKKRVSIETPDRYRDA